MFRNPCIRNAGYKECSGHEPQVLTRRQLRLRERVEDAIGPIVGGSQRVQVIERVTRMMTAAVFRGPLPHPGHLQAYEDTCSGSADRPAPLREIGLAALSTLGSIAS